MLSRRSLVVSGAITALAAGSLSGCRKAIKVKGPLGPRDPMEPGGPFHLIDQDGKPVDDSLLNGKWTAVYFGYTFCPDVCPTTLQALGGALSKLGPKAKDLQTLFISIDPERDTPAQMKTYISSPVFPRPIIGLTGSTDQVAAVAKAYKVYYAKAGTGTNYLMDHQSIIYLMNPDGRLARPLTHDLTPDAIAKQIGDAMSDYA
jgi:protein SCO1/2